MSSLNGRTPAQMDATIANPSQFWPDVTLQDFVLNHRLPAEYTEELLVDELQTAVTLVNDNPALIEITQTVTNYSDIEQFYFGADADAIGDIDHHYQRAVFSCARARLIDQYTTLNRTDAAAVQTKNSPELQNHFKSLSAESIRYIAGRVLGVTDTDGAGDNGAGGSENADTFFSGDYAVAVI